MNLLKEFEEISKITPETGKQLFEISARINAFWFRNRLPECDAHDTMNLIDSEGEERFEIGKVGDFGSEERFFKIYIGLYEKAMRELNSILESYRS